MDKLLETLDIQGSRWSLQKATTNAKGCDPEKSAFKLVSSLLRLLFTVDELANSCGQGLKKKANDTRPPLNPVKIQVLKGNVLDFCML